MSSSRRHDCTEEYVFDSKGLLPRHPSLVSSVLSSGLKYTVLPNRYPPKQVEVALYISTGSIHESDADAGLAHLTEHAVFLGTRRRPSAAAIRNQLERWGVSLGPHADAYTDYTCTVYSISFQKSCDTLTSENEQRRQVPSSSELKGGSEVVEKHKIDSNTADINLTDVLLFLKELVLECTVPADSLEVEKMVVETEYLESISTQSTIQREWYRRMGQKGIVMAQHPPAGTRSYLNYDREDVMRFMKEHYVPSKMHIFVVGDVETSENEESNVQRDIEFAFQDLPVHGCDRNAVPARKTEISQPQPSLTISFLPLNSIRSAWFCFSSRGIAMPQTHVSQGVSELLELVVKRAFQARLNVFMSQSQTDKDDGLDESEEEVLHAQHSFYSCEWDRFSCSALSEEFRLLEVTCSTNRIGDALRDAILIAQEMAKYGLTEQEWDYFKKLVRADLRNEAIEEAEGRCDSNYYLELLIDNEDCGDVISSAEQNYRLALACIGEEDGFATLQAVNDIARSMFGFIAGQTERDSCDLFVACPAKCMKQLQYRGEMYKRDCESEGGELSESDWEKAEEKKEQVYSIRPQHRKGKKTNVGEEGAGLASVDSSEVTSLTCSWKEFHSNENLSSPSAPNRLLRYWRETLKEEEGLGLRDRIDLPPPELVSQHLLDERQGPGNMSSVGNERASVSGEVSDGIECNIPCRSYRLSNTLPVKYLQNQDSIGKCSLEIVCSGGWHLEEEMNLTRGTTSIGMSTWFGSGAGDYSSNQINLYSQLHDVTLDGEVTVDGLIIKCEFQCDIVDPVRRALEVLHTLLYLPDLSPKMFQNALTRARLQREDEMYDLRDAACNESLKYLSFDNWVPRVGWRDGFLSPPSVQELSRVTYSDILISLQSHFKSWENVSLNAVGNLPKEFPALLDRYLGCLPLPFQGIIQHVTTAAEKSDANIAADEMMSESAEGVAIDRCNVVGRDITLSTVTVDMGNDDLLTSSEHATKTENEELCYVTISFPIAVWKDTCSSPSSSSKVGCRKERELVLFKEKLLSPALLVIQEIINSRLLSAMREEKGLAYEVSCSFSFSKTRVGWGVVSFTSIRTNLEAALSCCLRLLRSIQPQSLRSEEVDRAIGVARASIEEQERSGGDYYVQQLRHQDLASLITSVSLRVIAASDVRHVVEFFWVPFWSFVMQNSVTEDSAPRKNGKHQHREEHIKGYESKREGKQRKGKRRESDSEKMSRCGSVSIGISSKLDEYPLSASVIARGLSQSLG